MGGVQVGEVFDADLLVWDERLQEAFEILRIQGGLHRDGLHAAQRLVAQIEHLLLGLEMPSLEWKMDHADELAHPGTIDAQVRVLHEHSQGLALVLEAELCEELDVNDLLRTVAELGRWLVDVLLAIY